MDKENKTSDKQQNGNDFIANDGARTFTPPIRVRVKLRQSQYTGVTNKWICTIYGEKREVTMREVEWYCMSVEGAVHSFKESEIESFSIVGQYPSR